MKGSTKKICRQKMSIMFNEIHIYKYICVCVCVCVCMYVCVYSMYYVINILKTLKWNIENYLPSFAELLQ